MKKLEVGDFIRKKYRSETVVVYKLLEINNKRGVVGLIISNSNGGKTTFKIGSTVSGIVLIDMFDKRNYDILSRDEVIMEML